MTAAISSVNSSELSENAGRERFFPMHLSTADCGCAMKLSTGADAESCGWNSDELCVGSWFL